jgi:general stress protein 26
MIVFVHMTRLAMNCIVGAALLAPAAPAFAADAPPDRDRIRAAAFEVMKAARYCTLVTVGLDGHPQARVVDPHAPGDGTIWFATHLKTRKVGELKRDARVTMLCFNAAAGEYVTIQGRARPTADPQVKAARWKADWQPYYKEGHADPTFALFEVRPSRLEVSAARLGMANDPETWRPVILDLRAPATTKDKK